MAVIKNAESDRLTRGAAVLDLGDLRLQAEALEQRAVARANALIHEARLERGRILAGVTEEGQQAGHAAGLAQGIEEGRRLGHEEALASVRARLDELAAAWEQALREFGEARDQILLAARADVVRLAAVVAARVTRRIVSVDPEVVKDQLEAALSMTLRPKRLMVEVSPADLETARQVLPALVERLAGGVHADVVAKESLSPGSACIRTEGGSVDASIDTQLERIVAAMVPGGVPERAAPRPGPVDAEGAG